MKLGHNTMAKTDATGCERLTEFMEPRLFKALCDRTRIDILAELAQSGGTRTVGQIAAKCPVDISVVSRHLATLRDAGIVEAARRGKEVHYRVRYEGLAQTLRAIADAIEACCPPLPRETEGASA